MKAIAVIGGLLGLAVLSACSSESDEAGGEAGAAGDSGASGGTSGSGGDGGTSTNGGSAGVAGASSGSGGGTGCGCVQELSWGQNGGFVAYQDTNRLEPCHTFTIEREQFGTEPMTLSCTDPIDSCDDIVNPSDIQAALDHPDVFLAFASSPVLYGRDTRPVDGTVFQIHNGSLLIEIGWECGDAENCTDAPPGVLALQTLLETLTEQLLARPPCSDVF